MKLDRLQKKENHEERKENKEEEKKISWERSLLRNKKDKDIIKTNPTTKNLERFVVYYLWEKPYS